MTDDEKKRLDIDRTNEALIDYGLDAISKMTAVAEDTEHPRAYEVLSKLIKDVSEINNSRLDNDKKVEEIERLRKGPAALPDQNDKPTVLAITTDQLLRGLQNQAKEKDITPVSNE
jgi:hypothetical protein